MKIAYILPYDWGGMPHYTAELANAVSKHADVTVFGSKGINESYFSDDVSIVKAFDVLDYSMADPLKALSPANIKSLYSFKKVSELEKIRPDVIHMTTPIIPSLAFFMFMYGLDKRYPVVYTKHGLFSNSGWKVKRIESVPAAFEKLLRFRKIIVHTENDCKMLSDRMEVEKISVIPHGIYSFFTGYGTNRAEEKNTILFFGNIRKYKGLEYLIDAASQASKEIGDLKVIIAGQGDMSPYEHLLQGQEALFEIHNRFIDDREVPLLFQRAQAVILPYSVMSGQSGILNIAYAFNKPVVASNVPGIGESVKDGETGYVVDAKNSSALSEAIIRLLQDENKRNDMKKKISEYSRELSWDVVAGLHMNLYEEISRERRASEAK
jgi:alpha-maltose-1-phosphate synthase